MTLVNESPVKEVVKKNFNAVKIPVRLAFLHQSVSIPGCTTNEKTWSEAKIKGLKMWWTPAGLYVEVKNSKAIIPSANVAVAIWEDASAL